MLQQYTPRSHCSSRQLCHIAIDIQPTPRAPCSLALALALALFQLFHVNSSRLATRKKKENVSWDRSTKQGGSSLQPEPPRRCGGGVSVVRRDRDIHAQRPRWRIHPRCISSASGSTRICVSALFHLPAYACRGCC